jgi:hypothetical protein
MDHRGPAWTDAVAGSSSRQGRASPIESLMVLALRTAEIFYRYYANRSLKPTRRVGMTPGGVER